MAAQDPRTGSGERARPYPTRMFRQRCNPGDRISFRRMNAPCHCADSALRIQLAVTRIACVNLIALPIPLHRCDAARSCRPGQRNCVHHPVHPRPDSAAPDSAGEVPPSPAGAGPTAGQGPRTWACRRLHRDRRCSQCTGTGRSGQAGLLAASRASCSMAAGIEPAAPTWMTRGLSIAKWGSVSSDHVE